MAVTSVNQIPRDDGEENEDSRLFRDLYLVHTDSASDNAATVLAANDLPKVGNAHPSDSGALVVSVRPRRHSDSRLVWEVEVEYSTNATGGSSGGGGGGEDDPLDMRWKRKWSTATVDKVVERAKRLGYQVGTAFRTEPSEGLIPVANTVGDAFDPPIEEPVFIWVLTITRNEPLSGFPARAKPYMNAICAANFYAFGERRARMANIEATEQSKGDLRYYEVTYEIHFGNDEHFWDRLLLNHGFRHKEAGETGKVIDLDNGKGRNLDVEGRILGEGAEAVFIVFETKEVTSFGPLQLEY